MRRRNWKTKTSFYFLSIIILAVMAMILYFMMYREISQTVYEKEETNIDIFANQIEGTLDLICNSVNTDLSRFVEDETVQDIFSNGEANRQEYSYMQSEIEKTIAFNNYNSFIEIYIYADDTCIYPENGEGMQEFLSEEEIEAVDRYNGNTAWLHKNEKQGEFVAAKKVLLSSEEFRPAGYIVAFININIMEFIQEDFASMEDARIVLSNEFGEIAVKEAQRQADEGEKIVTFEKTLSVPGFKISFYIPQRVLLESVYEMQTIMFQSILVAFVLFLMISYVMSAYITYPFKDLIKIMQKSEGHLVTNEKQYFNYEANQFNEYYNKLVKKNQALIHDIYEKDIQMLQTRIEMLQTQINPHFLYNTLESVYLTLEAKGEKESAQIVYLLSKLFKYALKADKTIALRKEIEMVERYLEIETYRFGSRFQWKITVDKEVEDIKIPKLLLQPLAENAIKHGIEPSDRDGMIQISITAYEETLVIMVYDNGVGVSEEKADNIRKKLSKAEQKRQMESSIGLENVYKRLVNYYGEDAKLEIDSEEDSYYEVTIIIKNYKKLGKA